MSAAKCRLRNAKCSVASPTFCIRHCAWRESIYAGRRITPSLGLPVRPIVAAIIGVVAGDHGRVPVGRNSREMRIELVLAVVAAVRGVGAIVVVLELAGLDDFVPEAELLRNLNGEHPVALRIAG